MSTGNRLNCAWRLTICLLLVFGADNGSVLRAQRSSLPPPEIITARQGLPQAFVPAIVQDKRGFIWLATRDGLARYDGYTFRVFQPSAGPRPSLSSPGLTNLTLAPDGSLWIQNDQFGLDGFDPLHETFINLSRQPDYRKRFGTDTLRSVYPDAHRRLWLIFRRQGLARYDLDTKQLSQFTHQADQPHPNAVMEDGQGQLWVATDGGLDRFDPATNRFVHAGYPGAKNGEPVEPIQRLYRRPAGDFWLGTTRHLIRWDPRTKQTQRYALPRNNEQVDWPNQLASDRQGNDYISASRQLFRYSAAQGLQPLTTPTESVLYVSLFVDQSDVLWAGTDLAGVQKFNLRTPAFQNRPYQHSFVVDWLTDYAGVAAARIPEALAGTTAYNFRSTIDSQGQLWFAVGGTPLYRLDPATHQLTTIPGPATLYDYKLERPTLLSTDPDGRVWVVHRDWSGYFQADQNRWIRFPHPFQAAIRSAMLQAVVDRQALWIATASTGLYRIDRRSGQIRQYRSHDPDSTTLSSDNLYCLNADPLNSNQLWIGTFGRGVCRFDKRTGRCQRITTRQGLPNNVVYAAIPDRSGSVWLATNQGLGQLDRATGRVRVYRQEDGLGADEFNRFHAVSMPDRGTTSGRIILGSIAGLVGFVPRAIRQDTFQPRVQVSAILVNNRLLPVDSLLRPGGDGQLRELTLPYNQHFVTVRFAAMQYNRLGQATYRYQLAGLSADWVVTTRPEAIFTALPPGQYQLRIQAANTAGQWSRHVRQLTLIIQPPWWRRIWAYLAYGILAVGGLWAYSRFHTRQIQGRQQRLTQQREATQLRQLDELKTRFFANVTHELRTPLTLILGPAQHLQTRLQDPEDQHWLAMIDRQAHQLLSLTNQLLDLSRLEAGVVRVNEQPGDLAAFVAQVVESVRPEADRKGLALTLTRDLPALLYAFDAEKLERILLNLLTNAIKFTPHGSVQVGLRAGVALTVEDTGPGLTAAEQERVFDRFYQATPQSASSPGSGIGLSLVSELVTLQRGTVRVESPWTTTHSGTRFVVQLPYSPVSPTNPAYPPADPVAADAHPGEPPTDSPPDEWPRVLVVEDNAELRAFVSQAVATFGRVLTAEDGLAGWAMALEGDPALIISDVLMPRLDGFALCRRLKEDPRTSHIPVLLLTAKTTFDDRMQGLSGGADEYLTKPFHVEELQLRVRNLLATQRRLVEKIRADLQTPVAPDETIHPFLRTLYQVLNQHLDDAAFGGEELARQVRLSRMQLYRKLKTLTGLAATDFIRAYRLKRAVALLQQGLPVTQVAYAVGFESASYFGQCFREQFGESPSQFIHKVN